MSPTPVPDADADAVVLVTVAGDDREALALIAASAVAGRLAACAQLGGPVRSVYRWDGEIETAEEWTLGLKTAADRVDELVALVVTRHEYDTPEVVVTPVVGGYGPYLEWVREETRPEA
ncbi:unannotated protein [freshwater metagenome]|uniref:Unannotated protein n=1 Tax=freshwater metagenome TaxID=449393 RepID=A0A6J7J8W7_9ZZZZ|nr:divalent cation tolerance protein CutA [Actinomycetota bacterium]